MLLGHRGVRRSSESHDTLPISLMSINVRRQYMDDSIGDNTTFLGSFRVSSLTSYAMRTVRLFRKC